MKKGKPQYSFKRTKAYLKNTPILRAFEMFLFLVAKQLNIWPRMSVCLSVPNFSYIVKEVNEVDELDEGNISDASGI